jgi:hypothetical protein
MPVDPNGALPETLLRHRQHHHGQEQANHPMDLTMLLWTAATLSTSGCSSLGTAQII